VIDGTADGDLTARAIASNSGEATLDNFLVSPMFGFSTDLGLDLPIVIGGGFYAPFGGQAVWDSVAGDPDLPGTEDGSQRWYTIDGTIRALAYSLGVAFRLDEPRISFGLSANLYQHDVHTVRARNSTGGEELQSGDGTLSEGRSRLEVSGTNFGVGAGVLWEAMPDQLWIGLSYQSQPGFGLMELEGSLHNVFGPTDPQQPQDVLLRQELPDIIRLGGRYRPSTDLELRLFVDYTRWSVLDEQCVVNKNAADAEAACKTVADGGADSNVILYLPRNWEDTFGARLSASYWVIARAGAHRSAAATTPTPSPTNRLEPALYDMDKVTASLGACATTSLKNVGLVVTATNVFYAERDTTERPRPPRVRASTDVPAKQPSSTAVYNQNIFLLNANLAPLLLI
jgi:long-chain fatty acid transport protein